MPSFLLLGRKVMTNLDSILKSRDITLPTEVRLVKAMVFPVVHHWLNGRDFEWTPGVGDGQGSLACCDSLGGKESDMTERLNWTDAHCVSDAIHHLILCHPLLLLPSIFPSIRVFSNESALRIRWPKYWTSVSLLPMNIQDWFPLGWTGWISLQSKGLKSLLQHHSSKA